MRKEKLWKSKSTYLYHIQIIVNIVTGVSMLAGAFVAYHVLEALNFLVPIILSLAASSMIYVAISDLIPSLHKKTEIFETVKQSISILMGVMTIYLLHSMIH